MNEQVKILLVEDDTNLGFVTKDNLEENGYLVDWAVDGLQGWEKFDTNDYDICLLDVMLPKEDGFTLGSRIREVNKDIPILFLTAKGMLEDKVKGFELGGDDYIVKPFSIKELVYRIEVFRKRSVEKGETPAEIIFEWDNFRYNYTDLNLTVENNTKVLTQKEADLLLFFCRNKNRILKREEILKELWGDDDYFMGRSLDVFISRLRKYLKDANLVEIVNYHGVGFKFQVNK